MDKIKEFFNKKLVKKVAWAMALIGDAALILGGTAVKDITAGAELVFGIIGAVGLLVVFIQEKLK